jgi:colicin import membrane protein
MPSKADEHAKAEARKRKEKKAAEAHARAITELQKAEKKRVEADRRKAAEDQKRAETERREAARLEAELQRRQADANKKAVEIARRKAEDDAKRGKAVAEAQTKLRDAQAAYERELERVGQPVAPKPTETTAAGHQQ